MRWKYVVFKSPSLSQLMRDFCRKYNSSISLRKFQRWCKSRSVWNVSGVGSCRACTCAICNKPFQHSCVSV
ncbi:unnamed protein product [Brassica rapa subsp. trilocularis]